MLIKRQAEVLGTAAGLLKRRRAAEVVDPPDLLECGGREEAAAVISSPSCIEEGRTFIGQVQVAEGTSGFVVLCEEASALLAGAQPKITWKSNAPDTLEAGSWIEFGVVDTSVAQDWSSPLAIDVLETQRPNGAEHNYSSEGIGGSESSSTRIKKSSAVSAFRTAQATGQKFAANDIRKVSSVQGLPRGSAGSAGSDAAIDLIATPPREPFQRVFLEPPESLPEADQKVLVSVREELQISVEGEQYCIFPPVLSFEELEELIPEYALQSLANHGIESPMPIQAQALPFVLAGHDLVGIARTGSGKTLAYLLPALVQIESQEPVSHQAATPICLILAPVRELAVQICEEAKKLLSGSSAGKHGPWGIQAACAFGGGSSNKGWQIAEIRRGCHILAATPGRLVDLISSGAVRLKRVTYFVLDEADRMLECGFGDQVSSIALEVRPDRQTVFFSATWPAEVQALAERMCHGHMPPVHVSVGQRGQGAGPATRDDIVQEVVVFDQGTWDERDLLKQELLCAHLREVGSNPAFKALVFVGRRSLADDLVNALWMEGFAARAMHGGRTQDKRLEILDEFRKDEIKLLVTTDVMGRGLDIPDISHVVCFDMGAIDDYVHRIGRTARGPYGQGHALTFFEYDRKWAMLAQQLVEVLQQSGQEAPEDLVRIAQEVECGRRPAK